MWGTYCITEKLLASQEGICSMKFLSYSLECLTGLWNLMHKGCERKYTWLKLKLEINLAYSEFCRMCIRLKLRFGGCEPGLN